MESDLNCFALEIISEIISLTNSGYEDYSKDEVFEQLLFIFQEK
jgi:hypothetical protein